MSVAAWLALETPDVSELNEDVWMPDGHGFLVHYSPLGEWS